MKDPARPPLGDAAFDELLTYARLDLTPERKIAASPGFAAVLALLDSLEGIELGETPPAAAFDPSWE